MRRGLLVAVLALWAGSAWARQVTTTPLDPEETQIQRLLQRIEFGFRAAYGRTSLVGAFGGIAQGSFEQRTCFRHLRKLRAERIELGAGFGGHSGGAIVDVFQLRLELGAGVEQRGTFAREGVDLRAGVAGRLNGPFGRLLQLRVELRAGGEQGHAFLTECVDFGAGIALGLLGALRGGLELTFELCTRVEQCGAFLAECFELRLRIASVLHGAFGGRLELGFELRARVRHLRIGRAQRFEFVLRIAGVHRRALALHGQLRCEAVAFLAELDTRGSATRRVVYWSKEQYGYKPTLSVTELSAYRDGDGGPMFIASKQIYATHYFEGSLGISVATPAGPTSQDGFFLMHLNRSRIDSLRGMLGGMKRALGSRRLRRAMEDSLRQAKAKVEAWRG